MHEVFLSSFLLLTAVSLSGQTTIDVGNPPVEAATPAITEELQPFVSSFDPSDVGFMHVYVDPRVDPLETYLLRGRELPTAATEVLPAEFQKLAGKGKMYGAISIMGIEEDLYLTRYVGSDRQQIDMFALRDGEIVHLKTLAYLNCTTPGDCPQQDSYITDLNLDTTFDLVQITRQGGEDENPERAVFTMLPSDKTWTATDEMDVPWEGITFYHQTGGKR